MYQARDRISGIDLVQLASRKVWKTTPINLTLPETTKMHGQKANFSKAGWGSTRRVTPTSSPSPNQAQVRQTGTRNAPINTGTTGKRLLSKLPISRRTTYPEQKVTCRKHQGTASSSGSRTQRANSKRPATYGFAMRHLRLELVWSRA